MRLPDYLNRDGAAKALAAVLQIPEPTVSQWKNGKRRVPADRCIAVEKATGGAVSCEELRPDLDWAYLRQSCRCDTPADQAA